MQTKLQRFFKNATQSIVTSIEGSTDVDAVSAEIVGSHEVVDGILEVASATNEVITVESAVQQVGKLSNAKSRVYSAGIVLYRSIVHFYFLQMHQFNTNNTKTFPGAITRRSDVTAMVKLQVKATVEDRRGFERGFGSVPYVKSIN